MRLSLLLSCILSAAGLAACSDKIPYNRNEEFSIQMTTPVPNAYFAQATQRGTVELFRSGFL